MSKLKDWKIGDLIRTCHDCKELNNLNGVILKIDERHIIFNTKKIEERDLLYFVLIVDSTYPRNDNPTWWHDDYLEKLK